MLPKVERREASVHVSLFQPSKGVSKENANLFSNWQKLLDMRTRVFGRLEELRAQKIIGKSLEAKVTLDIPTNEDGNSFLLFTTYVLALPELFNVSDVEIEPVKNVGGAYGPEIRVQKSASPKCERCWRCVDDVGNDTNYPTVCLRCAEALHALDFPPYEKLVEATT